MLSRVVCPSRYLPATNRVQIGVSQAALARRSQPHFSLIIAWTASAAVFVSRYAASK